MSADTEIKSRLITLSDLDIARELAEYDGNNDPERYLPFIPAMRAYLTLEWTQRGGFLQLIGAFTCTHCGSAYLPCYCMRND